MMNKDVKIHVELPDVVNKTLEKPATTMGEKLSDLIEIIFGGITYTKEKLSLKRKMNFKQFKSRLEDKIDSIPKEKRMEPSESIIGPALEAAKYRIDTEQIQELFANLIASSLHKEKSELVHPAFIEIIKNLSSKDAQVIEELAYMRDSHIIPIISVDEHVMSIPNNSNHYCAFSDKYGFHETNIILSSLLRTGLIEFNYVFSKDYNFQGFTFHSMEEKFAKLRGEHKVARNLSEPLQYKYGAINLTALGYEFAMVCVPNSFADDARRLKNN